MTVERIDNHRSAKAKVRWHRRKPDGSQMLGIELARFRRFLGVRQKLNRGHSRRKTLRVACLITPWTPETQYC